MSQSSNKGRRTPLTLGNNKHANGRKNNIVDANVIHEKPSNNEPATVEQLKQKAAGDAANHQNGRSSSKNGNGTSADKNVATVAPNLKELPKDNASKEDAKKVEKKDESAKSSKKEESKKDDQQKKDVTKQEEQKREVPKKDEKSARNVVEETENTNGSAVKVSVTPSAKNGDKSDVVRESPRQKEMREKEEKEQQKQQELQKQQEQKEIDEALAAFKAQEETEKLVAPVVTITPATPEVKQAECTPSKKISSVETTPVKASPEPSKQKRNTTIGDPSISLLEQSDMHGFEADCDDMEELRMESDGFGDSPMPKSAKAQSKILKFSNSPSVNRARVSPFRRSTETNASNAVNLSTVSEQSTEAANSPALPVGPARIPGEQCYGSLRHISGRKSTRPLRELTLQHTMRESYRRIKTDLDDSFSSMNATVGSEIPNESFSTPMVAVKGRKRVAIGGSEPDLSSAVESPKKARLDLSGFFSVMASPVTLLRNKFSRASLLSSTPNKKLNIDLLEPEPQEEEKHADGDLNVSGIEDVQMVEIDLGKGNQTAVVVEVASDKPDEGLDVVPVVDGEIVIETEQLKSLDDIKDKIAEQEALHEEGTVKITEKKSRCAVM